MNTTVAIIIPLYKTHLSPMEEISIQQCFKVLSNYSIIVVKPQNINLDNYNVEFNDIVSFEDEFFSNISGYNRLMLSSEFYRKFLQYKFVLIYQLDAFVFSDNLLYWCNRDYDYIGAPWLMHAEYPDVFKKIKNGILSYLHVKRNTMQLDTDLPSDLQFENRVGNGGFSLRKTRKFYELCGIFKELIKFYNSRTEHYFNEDIFWSIEVNRKKKHLKIPDYKEAVHFSIEHNYDHALRLTKGNLPFGCHAWDLHLDFWKPIFERFGVTIK